MEFRLLGLSCGEHGRMTPTFSLFDVKPMNSSILKFMGRSSIILGVKFTAINAYV